MEARLARAARAARADGLEFLLGVIAGGLGPAVEDRTVADAIRRFCDLGVRPDWWKPEPMRSDAA